MYAFTVNGMLKNWQLNPYANLVTKSILQKKRKKTSLLSKENMSLLPFNKFNLPLLYMTIPILSREQDELDDIRQQDDYKIALKYLLMFVRKTWEVNRGVSSYYLKNKFEKFLSTNQINHYISNDAFIVAMNDLGYTCVQCRFASPNYYFNCRIL